MVRELEWRKRRPASFIAAAGHHHCRRIRRARRHTETLGTMPASTPWLTSRPTTISSSFPARRPAPPRTPRPMSSFGLRSRWGSGGLHSPGACGKATTSAAPFCTRSGRPLASSRLTSASARMSFFAAAFRVVRPVAASIRPVDRGGMPRRRDGSARARTSSPPRLLLQRAIVVPAIVVTTPPLRLRLNTTFRGQHAPRFDRLAATPR